MKRQNRQQKSIELRKQFPFFSFQKYSYKINNEELEVEFLFNLSNTYFFRPSFKIASNNFFDFTIIDKSLINNFVFHIGMIELVSYWKASCSKEVRIETHLLDEYQVSWWKKLYFNGLGEFFYLNSLEVTIDNFMNISSKGKPLKPHHCMLNKNNVLVPVGGGKDSIVTLELLKNSQSVRLIPFVINPLEASVRSIVTSGFSLNDSIVVERHLDPQLLKLNRQGFLNGHTPFSALLAFVSSFAAALSGSKYVALSNESSANESTIPGSKINHQYSKSFEFEEDFNHYLKKYVHENIYYFSFLRPLNELQIASIFSLFDVHHTGFRSCNVGSKTGTWCGRCPKCLFTWLILSPFIPQKKLEHIFGKNLLENNSLRTIYQELTGIDKTKPFECVGTPQEVNAAIWKTFSHEKNIPLLITDFAFHNQKQFAYDFEFLTNTLNNLHHLPEHFLQIIKKQLNA